jgi:hypothetical protein
LRLKNHETAENGATDTLWVYGNHQDTRQPPGRRPLRFILKRWVATQHLSIQMGNGGRINVPAGISVQIWCPLVADGKTNLSAIYTARRPNPSDRAERNDTNRNIPIFDATASGQNAVSSACGRVYQQHCTDQIARLDLWINRYPDNRCGVIDASPSRI